jgi:hypothetical protein
MRRHRIMTTLAVPAMVLSLTLGLTGCGGAADRGANNASDQQAGGGSDQDKELKFAKCMRDNGVDMPDPQPGTGRGAEAAQAANPAFEKAYEKCRALLPNGGQPAALTAEERASQMKFAKCMRDNGVSEYPDPPADPNQPQVAVLPDRSDPAFTAKLSRMEKAAEKCGAPAGAVPVG